MMLIFKIDLRQNSLYDVANYYKSYKMIPVQLQIHNHVKYIDLLMRISYYNLTDTN